MGNQPVNGIDPLGLWRWYGNWGGPNWTGGQKGDWNTIDWDNVLPPIDEQDKCYRSHDICYGSCRTHNACKSKDRGNCFKECDRKAARCLRALGEDSSNNWYAKKAAEYFEKSNPKAD